MQIAPLIALDLPLKILIWEREHHAFVSYNEASHLAERYGLPTEQAAVLSPSTSSLTTLPSPQRLTVHRTGLLTSACDTKRSDRRTRSVRAMCTPRRWRVSDESCA